MLTCIVSGVCFFPCGKHEEPLICTCIILRETPALSIDFTVTCMPASYTQKRMEDAVNSRADGEHKNIKFHVNIFYSVTL
jgi:hypothetical protein